MFKGYLNIGENNSASVLTWEHVNKIRKTGTTNKILDLAKKYNVSCSAIRNVLLNRSWHDDDFIPGIETKTKKLNLNIVKQIRKESSHSTYQELADKYNVDCSSITNIVNNKSWVDLNYIKNHSSFNIKFSDEDKKNMVKDYIIEKIPKYKLIEKYNISRCHLTRIIMEYRSEFIQNDDNRVSEYVFHNIKFTIKEKQKMAVDFYQNNMTRLEIMEKYRVSYTSFYRIIKRYRSEFE